MAYYVSSDPEYNLQYNDALVLSFVKLVGKALEGESEVLFLTKEIDIKDGVEYVEKMRAGFTV